MKSYKPFSRESSNIIARAIMRHAGLSEFDADLVEEEVRAICKALYRNGYKIVKK